MIGYAQDAARDVLRHLKHLLEFGDKPAGVFATSLALAEARIERRPRTDRILKGRRNASI